MSDEQEDQILRTVTEKELNWLREKIVEVKNRGDGYGEIVITIRRGRIQKVKAAGEEIPDIYGDV